MLFYPNGRQVVGNASSINLVCIWNYYNYNSYLLKYLGNIYFDSLNKIAVDMKVCVYQFHLF